MEMEKQDQLTKESPQSLNNIFPKKYSNDNGDFISVYSGKQLTKKVWDNGIAQIRAAFPNLKDDWYNLLTAKIRDKKFTVQQFVDAVDNLITNCKYPNPQIADLLNYQKGVRIISRQRFLTEANGQSKEFYACFTAIDIDGELFYANTSELKRNNVQYKVWHKPITVPALNNNQTVSKDKRSNEKEPQKLDKSLNILDEFERISKLYETDPDFIKLSAAKKKAQNSWGNNAYEYDIAMKEIAILEQKLNIA